MSDPVRLLASADTTDLERELLQSWEDERPTSAARDKTLALLGVTSSVVAGGAAVGGSIAPKAVAAGWMVMAKWTVVSVLALSAIGLGVGYAVHRSTPKTYAVVQHVESASTTHPVVTTNDNAVVELPQTVEQNATAPARVAPSRPAPSASLSDQIAALDRARAALGAGDASRAKKLVDAYESEYPGGAFTQEAEVVRIDALVHEGNHDGAERAGKHFPAAYPKSPHAGRVRALLGYDP